MNEEFVGLLNLLFVFFIYLRAIKKQSLKIVNRC